MQSAVSVSNAPRTAPRPSSPASPVLLPEGEENSLCYCYIMEARKLTVTRARVLRKTMTAPEVRLWVVLRDTGQGGLKFRRQHPLGPYILDF